MTEFALCIHKMVQMKHAVWRNYILKITHKQYCTDNISCRLNCCDYCLDELIAVHIKKKTQRRRSNNHWAKHNSQFTGEEEEEKDEPLGIYTERHKTSTETLERIGSSGKVARYKALVQKRVDIYTALPLLWKIGTQLFWSQRHTKAGQRRRWFKVKAQDVASTWMGN